MFETELRIVTEVEALKVGETTTLSILYFNETGEQVVVSPIWTSTDSDILDVSNDGLVTAVSMGSAYIKASFENLTDSVMIAAGDETVLTETSRKGTFKGRNNYTVAGDFTLAPNNDGDLVLSFGSNFTASNGPGLFVYLSNSDNSVSGGIELGALKSNSGEQSYTLPMGTELNSYDFVIIYCKPFGVPFGYGKFEE